jgi:hypothetical protein
MTKAACLSIAIALVLSGVAHADPDTLDQGKSESVAIGLSAAGTLIGPALIGGALAYGDRWDGPLHSEFWPMLATGSAVALIGPSLGEWYAGQGLSRGLKVRLAGGAGFGVGAALIADGVHDLGNGSSSETELGLGISLAIAGAATVAIGGLLDIYDAPAAVREYNRAHVRVGLAPTAIGNHGHGLALVGTF